MGCNLNRILHYQTLALEVFPLNSLRNLRLRFHIMLKEANFNLQRKLLPPKFINQLWYASVTVIIFSQSYSVISLSCNIFWKIERVIMFIFWTTYQRNWLSSSQLVLSGMAWCILKKFLKSLTPTFFAYTIDITNYLLFWQINVLRCWEI